MLQGNICALRYECWAGDKVQLSAGVPKYEGKLIKRLQRKGWVINIMHGCSQQMVSCAWDCYCRRQSKWKVQSQPKCTPLIYCCVNNNENAIKVNCKEVHLNLENHINGKKQLRGRKGVAMETHHPCRPLIARMMDQRYAIPWCMVECPWTHQIPLHECHSTSTAIGYLP